MLQHSSGSLKNAYEMLLRFHAILCNNYKQLYEIFSTVNSAGAELEVSNLRTRALL